MRYAAEQQSDNRSAPAPPDNNEVGPSGRGHLDDLLRGVTDFDQALDLLQPALASRSFAVLHHVSPGVLKEFVLGQLIVLHPHEFAQLMTPASVGNGWYDMQEEQRSIELADECDRSLDRCIRAWRSVDPDEDGAYIHFRILQKWLSRPDAEGWKMRFVSNIASVEPPAQESDHTALLRYIRLALNFHRR